MKNQIVTEIFSRKSNAGIVTMPDNKLYCRPILTKPASHCTNPDMYVSQYNKIEDSEVNHSIFFSRWFPSVD